MPWRLRIRDMIGKPIGISFRDGTGASGVLCDIKRGVLYVEEYMYQDVFSLKQYDFNRIDNVHPFPPCSHSPRPPHQKVY